MADAIRAEVVDNLDPQKRGRLQVKSDALMKAGVAYPDWIPASSLFNWSGDSGHFAIPNVGDFVELEMAGRTSADIGARRISHIIAPDIKWKPTGEILSKDQVPAEALENYPNREVWKSTAGHCIIFDRQTGEMFIKEATEGSALIYIGTGADAAGGAFAVRFTELKTWADTHVHPTGIGPTGIASPALPTTAASPVIKVI